MDKRSMTGATLAIFILVLFLQQSEAARVKNSDFQALLSIKALWSTSANLSSWQQRNDCSKFRYIGCDKAGNVVTLVIIGVKLRYGIPAAIGNLPFLSTLYLQATFLNGGIPSQLCKLKNLVDLELYDNSLSGRIPACFNTLPKLTVLDLHSNLLKGSIPARLNNLKKLLILDLRSNKLTGTIPIDICGISLSSLYLWSNQLTGTIPTCLGTLPSLRYLALNDNRLYGTIPGSLSTAKVLGYLILKNNLLTGAVPVKFVNRLITYDVSGNYLSSFYSLSARLPTTCPTSYGNCLPGRSTCAVRAQNSARKCSAFCGVVAGKPAPCSGHGACTLGSTGKSVCICSSGFRLGAAKYTCVR